MATDARPYQASRLRRCTRYTPLTIGIHSLDSRAFQKKGSWVFSWRDTIQKKPQGMDISLRQDRAFNLETAGPRGCAASPGVIFQSLPRSHSVLARAPICKPFAHEC